MQVLRSVHLSAQGAEEAVSVAGYSQWNMMAQKVWLQSVQYIGRGTIARAWH